jgi:hypothetical protein
MACNHSFYCVVYSNRTIAGSEDSQDTSPERDVRNSLDPTATDNLPFSTVDEHIQVVDRSPTIVPPFSIPSVPQSNVKIKLLNPKQSQKPRMLSPRATTTLRLSAMSGAKMVTSSCSSAASSSMALRSHSLHLQFPSSGPRFSNGIVLRGNRVSFASSSTRFAHASLRCYASSAGSDRVRVENPIVEMDGEVFERRVIVCLAVACLVGEKMKF